MVFCIDFNTWSFYTGFVYRVILHLKLYIDSNQKHDLDISTENRWRKRKKMQEGHPLRQRNLKARIQRAKNCEENKSTYLRRTRQKTSRYMVFIDLEHIQYQRNIYTTENTEKDKTTNPSRNQESIFQGKMTPKTSR